MAHLDDFETQRANARFIRRAMQARLLSREHEHDLARRWREAGDEAALRRAAYTDDGALLFVHAGVDPARPLSAQSDSLWWATTAFSRIDRPIDGFRRVIRGFDPEHRGVTVGEFTVSVDAGCGFGGPLIAVCLDPSGDIVDVIEA